jgi:hypothetical protein
MPELTTTSGGIMSTSEWNEACRLANLVRVRLR